MAEAIDEPDQRAPVMADVALAMAPIDREKAYELFAHAEHAAILMPTELGQCMARLAVGRRLLQFDEAWAVQEFEQARVLAGEVRFPSQRCLALTEIARAQATVKPEMAAALLDEATIQARMVPDEELPARIAALRDISEVYRQLNPRTAQELFDEALSTAQGIADSLDRELALADLAGFIAQHSVQQALMVIDTITEPALKSQALQDAVLVIPLEEASIAKELALTIPDIPSRIETLSRLAMSVAEVNAEVARTAAEEATKLAEGLPANVLPSPDQGEIEIDETSAADTRNEALALAAAAWGSLDVDRALAAASNVPDEYYAAVARSSIAACLAHRDPERALTIALEVDRSVLRTPAIVAVLQVLATKDPVRTYSLVSEVRSRRGRVEVLLAVAANLPDGGM
ncbi:MAG: hypothetical protein ACUVX8_07935 [Candidatus Zipacnadales bacterium]